MSKSDRDQKIEDRDPKRAIGFVGMPILPGEDQEEFDAMQEDLYLQYEPVGPLEEVAVDTMAAAVWRIRHIGIFQRAVEARMRWGAYFHYPGDPLGDYRIIEEDRRAATAALAESVATFATKLQANEIAGFDAVNLEEPEVIGSQLVKQFSKGAAESEPKIDDSPNEGFAENSFIGMLTETLATAAKNNSERRTSRPIDPETMLHSVRKAAEEAVENCLKKKNEDAGNPRTSRERFERQIKILDHVGSVMDEAFGPGYTTELWERVRSEMVQQSLAKLGDLLTPEHYAKELSFLELLHAKIERNFDWLMQLQSERAKRTKSKITSLQPDWATRRRKLPFSQP